MPAAHLFSLKGVCVVEGVKAAIDLFAQVLNWQMVPGLSMKGIVTGFFILLAAIELWRYASQKAGY